MNEIQLTISRLPESAIEVIEEIVEELVESYDAREFERKQVIGILQSLITGYNAAWDRVAELEAELEERK